MPNSKVKNELCGQNHKMSNAYVDKFGRYIKWLTWWTLYNKMFTFCLNWWFQNGGCEKKKKNKKKQDPPQNFNNSATLNYSFKQNETFFPSWLFLFPLINAFWDLHWETNLNNDDKTF